MRLSEGKHINKLPPQILGQSRESSVYTFFFVFFFASKSYVFGRVGGGGSEFSGWTLVSPWGAGCFSVVRWTLRPVMFRGPRNGAFGKPCPRPWDTRHSRHFRRFTGLEQQNPFFTG